MGKLKKGRVILVSVIVVMATVIGFLMHKHSYEQTPEYTLKEIRTSLDNHDMKTFEKYVDVNNVIESSYPVLMEGLMESEAVVSKDGKTAMGDIFRMMKDSIIETFKSNIDHYVSTGSWIHKEARESAASELLTRSGLNQLELRNIEGITATGEKDTVIANILVYQHELGSEFAFEALLVKNEAGLWRVTEIRNLKDFIVAISQARKIQMDKYMQTAGDIIEKHNRIVSEAEKKYGDILSEGSLGNQNTRDSIKRLMTDVVQKDWEERKQELFKVEVPESAQSLHHLRLRICDLHIEYAKAYALWMTDKKAASMREANAKLKEANTMEQEERMLSRRINMMTQIGSQ